jgi:hypothetical protein
MYRGAFGYGKYSKFSSMGNGMTFTIETLIFAAAVAAVGSKTVCVYGDDIVTDTNTVPDLLRLLRFLGFCVNQDKSFHTGPFRESCGEHWYRDKLITPVYIGNEGWLKPDLCHLVNSLASIAEPYGALANYLKTLTVEEKLPFVPFTESTQLGVILDTHSAYAVGVIAQRRNTPWVPSFKGYIPKGVEHLNFDTRSLALWYLDAYRIRRPGEYPQGRRIAGPVVKHLVSEGFFEIREPILRSRTTLATRRYVRKWLAWHPPRGPTPGHLSWWSDHMLAP